MAASTSLHPKRGKLTSAFSNNKKAFAVTGLVFPIVAFVATLLVGFFFPPLLPVFLASFALGWVAFALIVAGATFLAWGLTALIAGSIQYKEESDDDSDCPMGLLSRSGSNVSEMLDELVTEKKHAASTQASREFNSQGVQTDISVPINFSAFKLETYTNSVTQGTILPWNTQAGWGLGRTSQRPAGSGVLSSISPSATPSPTASTHN